MFRLITLTLFLLLPSYLFSQPSQSKRPIKPITIDGSSQDWQTPFGLYGAETKLMFAIANDSTNLYLCFQCPDLVNQDKIMRAGMEVSLTQKGKKKRDASITFPLKKSAKDFKAEENYVDHKTTIREVKASFLLNNSAMLADGFATQNGSFPLKNPGGIEIAMNWDSANTLLLIYEVMIPLREFFGTGYTAEDLAKEITMEVEIYPIPMPDTPANYSGLNTNNGASVVNNTGMQGYGGNTQYNDPSGMQNGGYAGGMQGNVMGNYPANGMAGTGMQDYINDPNAGTAPQPLSTDISSMHQKAEMKQKFVLAQ